MGKKQSKRQHKQGKQGQPKKQSKPVFRVAGSRSLKAKNKTKTVNLQLGKIKEASRSGLEKANKQLEVVEDMLRQTSANPEATSTLDTSKPSVKPKAKGSSKV